MIDPMSKHRPPTPGAPQPPCAVSVPASTSNLGPGFDLLGLALSLRLEVTLRTGIRGDGGAPRFALETTARAAALGWPSATELGPERDLLVRAFERGRAVFGAPVAGAPVAGAPSPGAPVAVDSQAPVTFEVDTQIPVARGLGSSGAAVAAGLLLAAHRAPREVSRGELLALGIELERHPDNVTPALLGGLCAALLPTPEECSALGLSEGPRTVRIVPHPGLAFCVAWPDVQLATARARALLPASVPFADAVENPRRLALLLEGLRTGAPDLLALGGRDALHVPHRLPLVPGGADALARARSAGAHLATLSGSGTALFAIAPGERIEAVAEALREGLDAAREPGRAPAQARVVEPVLEAPVVREL